MSTVIPFFLRRSKSELGSSHWNWASKSLFLILSKLGKNDCVKRNSFGTSTFWRWGGCCKVCHFCDCALYRGPRERLGIFALPAVCLLGLDVAAPFAEPITVSTHLLQHLCYVLSPKVPAEVSRGYPKFQMMKLSQVLVEKVTSM